jgi:acyl dehydratase
MQMNIYLVMSVNIDIFIFCLLIGYFMSKTIINSYGDFEQYVGKELGVSDYLKITQERINLFADATLDYQWIHVNVERARKESPFKNTIAHGYLMVSILPYLWDQIIEVNNIKMLINYGIEKLKFNQPVVVDHEVRLRVSLASLVNLRGIAKAEIKVILEIKDSPKNALEETVIFLYHFNN